MAVPTKTISGKIYYPDATPWVGGTIYHRLNVPGTIDDSGTEQQLGGTKIVIVGQDGSVSFPLVPNNVVTPADTVHIIKMISPAGDVIVQHWRVLTTDPATIDIGDVTRVVTIPGGYAAGTLAALDDTDVSGVQNEDVLQYNSVTGKWEPAAGGSGGGDSDAIHDNVANEIALITEKTAPANDDIVIIEDSAAGYVKKKLKMSNLPGGAEDEYTTATRPSLVVGNKNTPYVVKDSGEPAHGEIIYETASAGVYAYFVTWQPWV
jgi:hypothetical protein